MRRLLSAAVVAAVLLPAPAAAARRPHGQVDAAGDRPARPRQRLPGAGQGPRRAATSCAAAAAPRRAGKRAAHSAARSPSSPSSPIRRSPTRCRPPGSTSSTPRAGRSSRRGGRRRRSGRRPSTPWCATSTPTGAARSRARKGKRARLGFALTTGDLADNQQLNETRWFRTVLDGGRVDPFSGQALSAANQCGTATPEEAARINADVAARRYTGRAGLRRLARRTGRTATRGYWDPDEAPPGGGPHCGVPALSRPDGARAGAASRAAGLDVPWYISRGNHDGLIQGNAPASTELFRVIATGCLKVFPNAADRSRRRSPASTRRRCSASSTTRRSSRRCWPAARRVPPDPDRRIVSKAEYRALMARGSRNAHGFAATPPAELQGLARHRELLRRAPGARACASSRSTRSPRAAARTATSTTRSTAGCASVLRAARKRDELVVVFGHHTLETMDNRPPTRRRARARPPTSPAATPIRAGSTPIHRGLAGRNTVRALLADAPERDRLRRRPQPRQRGPLLSRQQGPRLLAGQHRVAHRLAAAEPPARAVRQRRRDALAVRHDARHARRPQAAPGARARRSAVARASSSRSAACCPGTTRSGRGPRAPATAPASRARGATATWSCSCATRARALQRDVAVLALRAPRRAWCAASPARRSASAASRAA